MSASGPSGPLVIFPRVWYGVCEIELSQVGNNSRNPALVCENLSSFSGLWFF